MRWTRVASSLLMMAGGVLYATWLLAFVLPSNASPWTSYASELAAQGQPYAWVYRSGDLVSGTLFAAAGLLGLVALPLGVDRDATDVVRAARRRERVLLGLVVVFGLATIADAMLPMSCLETADAACRARAEAGAVPWRHTAHGYASALAGGSFWIALLVSVWRRPLGRWGRLLALLVATWSVATIWTLVAQLPGVSVHLLGLAQRLELSLTTICLVMLGLERIRRELPHLVLPTAMASAVPVPAELPRSIDRRA